MIKTAIVTPCKNRIADLKANLPYLINQDTGDYIKNHVVIVDYDCTEGTYAYCLSQPVHCVRIENRPYYHYSKTRNAGAKYAIYQLDVDYIILTDIDLRLFPWVVRQMVSKLIFDGNQILQTKYALPGAADNLGNLSLSCIHRDAYIKLRGYDESHTGYGHDDTNFYWRAERAGYKISNLRFYDLCNFHNASGNTKILGPGLTADENFIWATTERETNPNGWGEG